MRKSSDKSKISIPHVDLSDSSPHVASKDMFSHEEAQQAADFNSKTEGSKLNLSGLRAQSSSEHISNDLRNFNRDRRRTNSFAIRSAEEQENAENLMQWKFDFDADSDSIESFDST